MPLNNKDREIIKDTMLETMEPFMVSIQKEFNKIDKRFDKMDKDIDEIKFKLQNIERRIMHKIN